MSWGYRHSCPVIALVLSKIMRWFSSSAPAAKPVATVVRKEEPGPAPVPVVDVSRAGELLSVTGVNWNEAGQRQFVEQVLPQYVSQLAPLFLSEPFRGNPHCSPTDAAVLFAMIAQHEPTRLMEVGSGYSTLVMAHAKRVRSLPGEVIAIDPEPRIDVSEHVDAMVLRAVQEVPVEDFTIMMRGELLLIDSTHVYTRGNEVGYLLEKVLPALPEGILLGFHGVRLPRNYTAEELRRGYSEQEQILAYLRQRPGAQVLFSGGWMAEFHAGAVPAATKQDEESTALWVRI